MIGVDGEKPIVTATLLFLHIKNPSGVVPIGALFKGKLIPVKPSSSLGPGTLIAPPHMFPLFNPCFHQRNLLRFLLQSPFSHDHSSPSNAHSNDPHALFDDFQCMLCRAYCASLVFYIPFIPSCSLSTHSLPSDHY